MQMAHRSRQSQGLTVELIINKDTHSQQIRNTLSSPWIIWVNNKIKLDINSRKIIDKLQIHEDKISNY